MGMYSPWYSSAVLLIVAGYPMATNLRAKIAESDTMWVCDVNPSASEKLAKEAGNIQVAKSVREVAENAVCPHRVSGLALLP